MSTKFYGPGYPKESTPVNTTDGAVGGALYVGSTSPGQPQVGDIWIDGTTGVAVQAAKGDLVGYSGSAQVAVAVGANRAALVADSTTTSGLAWAFQADEIATIMGAL